MPHKKKPGLYTTSKGQPYRIMANGKARFVKKSSVKKKKGGSVSVGGGLGSMLGKRLDRAASRAASTVTRLAKKHVRGVRRTASRAANAGTSVAKAYVRDAKRAGKAANYATGGSVAVGGGVRKRRRKKK